MPDRFSRRDALKGLGGLTLGSLLPASAAKAEGGRSEHASHSSPKKPADRPNILWITGEGIPLSVLSCYGSKLISTPNIDRIANEGMRFENSFVTNALCGPSRATLITGTYSHINGEYQNPPYRSLGSHPLNPKTEALNQYENHFDVSQLTFPKIMQQGGYQTGLVGKWHIPINPGDAGFDYYVYREGAGGSYYNPDWLANASLGSKVVEKQVHPGYSTDTVTDLAIKGIRKFTQPFLMMVQYFNDHRPFDPPHKYEHLFDGVRIPEPGTFWDDYRMRASPIRDGKMRIEAMPDFNPPARLTRRQRRQWNYQKFMAHFLGALRAQDDNIGRLLEFLDQNGLTENTIVVYTSDHGFFMGDHGLFDKRFMYEQALRVPWMIRYPGKVPSGSVRRDWVLNIDNAPTALDLVGLPIPSVMQGRSLKPLLDGERPADWRKSMYYHYYEFGVPVWIEPHYGVRTERYKLINYYRINQWELFDLENDPDEMESLLEWGGYKVKSGYEGALESVLGELKHLRSEFRDTTGEPLKFWPTSSYD